MRIRFGMGCAVALGLFFTITQANAAPITAGNLLIYRVGDGAAALTNAATAVFLDEYTTGGSLVQSIAVSTSGGSALTATGNSTTEGIISASQDGTTLLYTGYRKTAGGTNPSADTYIVTNRAVGTITLTGTPDTSTGLTNDNGVTTASTLRSATSVNGTAGSVFWTSTSVRIGYNSTGLGASGGTVQIDARNSRQVNLYNNELMASNGSTTVTGKVQSYGTLPTGATAASPLVTLTLADAVNGFVAFDLSGSEAGIDTIYALSTVASQLVKWTKSSGTWSQTGSVSSVAASNMTGIVSGGNVNLYMTTGSALQTLTDTGGYNAAIVGSVSSLASAGANTAFRGIGMLVVPEPGALTLLLAGGALLLRRRNLHQK